MTKVKRLSRKKLTKMAPLLNLLSRLSTEDREIAATFLNDEACEAMCECVHNSITNLSTEETVRDHFKQETKPVIKTLRFLADENKPVSARQKKLPQLGGGILGLVLSLAIPLLTSFLAKK
jgi:hypothetical protein